MSNTPIPWKHIRDVLVLFAPVWVGGTLLFGAAGVVFSLLSSETWSARQPLVVRDEATNSVERLGRFASQTELKTAQETLLEMVQNPVVIAAALREVGPANGLRSSAWPSTKLIDEVATEKVNITAPKGSEFGSTEVVYLQVKAESQQRAADFCKAMFRNLTDYLRTVRRVRADSMISELTEACDVAKRDLDEVAETLRQIEIKFGSDLGDLRNLNDTISGDGTIRRELETTIRELQQADQLLRKHESLHQLLVVGSRDPQQLLISGHDLLSSQPSLERLKIGLIEAQLKTSELSGSLTAENPKLIAAVAREAEVRQRIQDEAAAVILAMEPALQLERDRIERLKTKQQKLETRLAELAEARTSYAKVDAEVRNRTEQLAAAQSALAEAKASREAALSSNLLVELGPPQVSDSPIGVSGFITTLAASTAGLIFGLGIVFLVAPGPTEERYGRRWSDYLASGGRRASDRQASSEQANTGRRSIDSRDGGDDVERRQTPAFVNS